MSRPIIRPYEPRDEPHVIGLWQRCGLVMPWNDPQSDIAIKLHIQGELFLVAAVEEGIVGSVMGGFDGHRGWVNYLAVSPELRHAGLGRLLMNSVEAKLRELGCPKLNLQIRRWNANVTSFYERLGYRVDDVISLGKRLDAK